MITWEAISKAVEPIKTIGIERKDKNGKTITKEYATVPERVKAFRTICPGGSIVTEIVSLTDSMVIMKSTITDEDGKVLSNGMAIEPPDSTYINKTSFIENCETSAVGRALGWLALGIDASMCSAEELVNAVLNQGDTPVAQTTQAAKPAPQKPQATRTAKPAPAAAQTDTYTVDAKARKQIIADCCERLGITTQTFGEYKRAAVQNRIIPDKMVTALTENEFGYLLNFVEANANYEG